jgi:hypothetical protein
MISIQEEEGQVKIINAGAAPAYFAKGEIKIHWQFPAFHIKRATDNAELYFGKVQDIQAPLFSSYQALIDAITAIFLEANVVLDKSSNTNVVFEATMPVNVENEVDVNVIGTVPVSIAATVPTSRVSNTSTTSGTLALAAINTSLSIFTSSATRKAAIIRNNTNKTVLLGLGFAPTAANYTYSLASGGNYTSTIEDAGVAINGVWTSGGGVTGLLSITEIF